MRGTFFGNDDVEIYLTWGEFNTISLPKLSIVKKDEKNKLEENYKSMEFSLQNPDGSDSGRRVQLQCTGSENSLGNGMDVNYNGNLKTYFIKLDEHASYMLDERGSWGTRYLGGEKIDIHISDYPR